MLFRSISNVHVSAVRAQRTVEAFALQAEAAKNPDFAPMMWVTATQTNIRRVLSGTGDVLNIFQSLHGFDEVAPGFASLVATAEAKVKASPGFAGGNVRLAIAANNTLNWRPLADSLMDNVKVGGQTAAQAPDMIKRFDYDPLDAGAVASAIVAFNPHIVITSGATEANRVILPTLEAAGLRPEYIASGSQATASLLDTLGANNSFRTRIVGIANSSGVKDPVRLEQMKTEYRAAYPTQPVAVTATTYDPAFLFAYALAVASAKSNQPPTSRLKALEIREAVAWVTNQSGPSFWSGPGDLNVGISAALQAPIRLRGITLSLDIDPAAGSSRDSSSVFCVGRTPTAFVINLTTGQSYDFTTKSIVGTFSCPLV